MPLIVRWPGVVPPESLCREVVTSVDFYPTLLEIADLQGDAGHNASVDGVSLMPLLRRNGTPARDAVTRGLSRFSRDHAKHGAQNGTVPLPHLARDAVYWHYPHYNPIGGYPYGAIRQGDWKLIEVYEDMHVELYNLRNDLGETTDLAAQQPERAATLRAKLHQWRTEVGAQMPVPN